MKTFDFEVLYLKHLKNLRQYCLYLTSNNFFDAEDLVQETFKRFIACKREEEQLTIAEEDILKYLKKVAINAFREPFRKKINKNNTIQLNEAQVTHEFIVKNSFENEFHLNEMFNKGFSKLSEKERKITLLFYVEEWDQKMIANECSISVSYVKLILKRVREKLQSVASPP